MNCGEVEELRRKEKQILTKVQNDSRRRIIYYKTYMLMELMELFYKIMFLELM